MVNRGKFNSESALLTYIRGAESGNRKDVLYGGQRLPQLLRLPLSTLIDKLRKRAIDGPAGPSTAFGLYGITASTLEDLIDRGFASPDWRFEEETQHRLASLILRDVRLWSNDTPWTVARRLRNRWVTLQDVSIVTVATWVVDLRLFGLKPDKVNGR